MSGGKWVQEKFFDCYVALGLNIVNKTEDFELVHVETHLQTGYIDPFYNVPLKIPPKNGNSIFVGRNNQKLIESMSGTSGVSIWKFVQVNRNEQQQDESGDGGLLIGQRHLVIMWSAPRNFYIYENTLSVGLTIGPPIDGNQGELFQKMYYGQMKQTFHTRFSCPYSTAFNSGHYGDNHFIVTGQIGGQHKEQATITIFDAKKVSGIAETATALMSALNDQPVEVSPTSYRANVKCLVHNHDKPMDSKIEATDVFYDYHLSLAFDLETNEENNLWICELGRRSISSNQAENFASENEKSTLFTNQTKPQVVQSRSRLGLLVFQLGKVSLDLRDVKYWTDHLDIEIDANRGRPVCHDWIRSLASKLNLPNQNVLELLCNGDNGWFGLDWLSSVREVFDAQLGEVKMSENEEDSWKQTQSQDEKVRPKVRIGGFEKLRMYRTPL